MAYLVSLISMCKRCHKRHAVNELFNNRNATMGKYCAPCSKVALKQQDTLEEETRQAHRSSTSGGNQDEAGNRTNT